MLAIIGANLAGLLIAGLFYAAMKRFGRVKRPGAKKCVPFLAFGAGAVLTTTIIGVWAANFGSVLGNFALILGAIAVLILIYAGADLADGEMDSKWTGVGLLALPLLAMGGFGGIPDVVQVINTHVGGGLLAAIGPWIGAGA